MKGGGRNKSFYFFSTLLFLRDRGVLFFDFSSLIDSRPLVAGAVARGLLLLWAMDKEDVLWQM